MGDNHLEASDNSLNRNCWLNLATELHEEETCIDILPDRQPPPANCRATNGSSQKAGTAKASSINKNGLYNSSTVSYTDINTTIARVDDEVEQSSCA
jgi:hypothetical protein